MAEFAGRRLPSWFWIGLIAVVVFAATAPTLSRLEFSSSMENLNVATVLEIHRTGNWLVPTLEGEMRLNKPPLTAWVTSLFVSDSLVARLNAHNPVGREAAYRDLAFRIRLAPLLETCLTILLVGSIAQITISNRAGCVAAAAYATSVMVLRLGRAATTDVQMTLWIALAHLGVVLVLWRGRRWVGCTIIGIATGLALMSKGPVCLLFIALPWIVLRLIARRRVRTDPMDAASHLSLADHLYPLVLLIALALLIGTPWYIYVLSGNGSVLHGWTTEVTRVGATENASSDPVFYLAVFPYLTPWLPWAIVGMVVGVRELRLRRGTPAVWLLLAAMLPLLVMSFFPDRKDRYALPAMIPLAVLVALGVEQWRHGSKMSRKMQDVLTAIHSATLAVLIIVLPAIGLGWLKTADDQPWFSTGLAIGSAIGLLAVWVIGLVVQAGFGKFRGRPLAFVGTTVAIMLLLQPLFLHGYSKTQAGLSEMKPLADAIRKDYPEPGPIINGRDKKRISVDLAIYLNRSTIRDPNWRARPLTEPPSIVLLPQQKGSPDPVPPKGWRVLTKVPRDENWMWALVRSEE